MRSHLACSVVTTFSSPQKVCSRVIQPLLVSISIHDLVSKLQSELIVFYLDDVTIGGSFQDVLAYLRLVELEDLNFAWN